MQVIEVFADVACPFTHVGLRRLVARRAAAGRDTPVLVVRAWPLELVNGHALDPGFVAEEVEALREQVAPDLFTGFDRSAFPATSIPAFALAHAAYAAGPVTGERVSLALRHALFEEGRDIASDAVLRAVAAAHGLGPPDVRDVAAVHAEWEDGRRRGVVGSPHFFVGTGGYFCPALHISRVDGELQIRADADALERVLAAAIAA
ncbi:MAG TPA: DsbA family protein [Acidimicrobiia bacterium]|nr:DsbA family protein [Acidimicrobiia bacterium]